MANVLVDETALQDIADAIRTKNGTQNTYKPGQMADAIEAIPSGGITPTGTVNINTNGTTDVTQYASANVAVPNSYAAADEGKVVSNGALVAQGSDTVTANDTYDTTLINSLTVNVSGSGGITQSTFTISDADATTYATSWYTVSGITCDYYIITAQRSSGNGSYVWLYTPLIHMHMFTNNGGLSNQGTNVSNITSITTYTNIDDGHPKIKAINASFPLVAGTYNILYW